MSLKRMQIKHELKSENLLLLKIEYERKPSKSMSGY